MKQQVYMKLLEQMEEAIKYDSLSRLKVLAAKSRILRKGGNASASVIRELMNS